MRIVHVITRLILGGAQENTLLSCEGLLRRYGDDVLLVTGPAVGPEGSLIERGRAGGVPIEVVPELRRTIDPWRDAIAYRRLKKILSQFRPDVVHTHSAKGGILGRAAAARLRVPAIVHTVHGAPFHPYQNQVTREFYRRCERWAARRCHAMVSVCDAMTDLLVAAGVAPRAKFTTIYSGMEIEPLLAADGQRERVRRELGIGDDQIVVGMVARLFHLKGHEFLLRAAPAIVGARPEIRFLLVGDGVLRAQLEAEVGRLGLGEHFLFLGLAPPQRIPELIASMDIVVHTSLREGLARVLPQALIVGRPVVSYDIDGGREVVLDGQTGLLLPPKSIAPLAEAILRLAADPALRVSMGAEGRRLFTDQFRHDRMVDELRQLYERLLMSQKAACGS
ncbi:MAG TPA: glycosyltransferase family 4 protein [Pirellulales bacterium]|jgi:glycosyltransferase involved in cell wall biosynthesis|nr:glycosyltransferase family 4 protein [Pirellulales bacterium]